MKDGVRLGKTSAGVGGRRGGRLVNTLEVTESAPTADLAGGLFTCVADQVVHALPAELVAGDVEVMAPPLDVPVALAGLFSVAATIVAVAGASVELSHVRGLLSELEERVMSSDVPVGTVPFTDRRHAEKETSTTDELESKDAMEPESESRLCSVVGWPENFVWP